VEVLAMLGAAVLAVVLLRALRTRAWRPVELAADGVPIAPMDAGDDDVGFHRDGSVAVRQDSVRATNSGRFARGSVPPPIMREQARAIAGEIVLPPSRRPSTQRPSVDDNWDLSDT
jgi:hypothetical protein